MIAILQEGDFFGNSCLVGSAFADFHRQCSAEDHRYAKMMVDLLHKDQSLRRCSLPICSPATFALKKTW